MKRPKGGYVILAAAIFGAGWLSAPDAVVHTRDRVHVIRVPDDHIVWHTKTNVTNAPLKEVQSCSDARDAATSLYKTFTAISAAVAPIPQEISEARIAISNGDVAGTTPSAQVIMQSRQKIGLLNVDYLNQLALFDALIKTCKSALK